MDLEIIKTFCKLTCSFCFHKFAQIEDSEKVVKRSLWRVSIRSIFFQRSTFNPFEEQNESTLLGNSWATFAEERKYISRSGVEILDGNLLDKKKERNREDRTSRMEY